MKSSTLANFRILGSNRGFAVIGVVILMALAVALVIGALAINSTKLRTTLAGKKRTERYYDAESSLFKAVAWLRNNSEYMVTPFTRENFYSSFDVNDSPVDGNNEGDIFSVPTRLKLEGTNNSAILVNGEEGATASFPNTQHIETEDSFDAASEFANLDFGGNIVRITLVNAVAAEDADDYGEDPDADPITDFAPVYRVDAMTDTVGGAHVYGFVAGQIVTSPNGCTCDCNEDDGAKSGKFAASEGSGGSGESADDDDDDGGSGDSGDDDDDDDDTGDEECPGCDLVCVSSGSADGGKGGKSGGSGDDDDDDDSGSGGSGDDDDDDDDGGSGDSGSGGGGNEKVTICHIPPGNPSNAHTITVGAPAVPAHLAHGDVLGVCPEQEDITICYYPPDYPDVALTITIDASELSDYEDIGATVGACPALDIKYRVRNISQLYKQ